MERHQKNAQFLAEYLRGHEAVEKLYYPGFADFPGYEIHNAQAAGPGAIPYKERQKLGILDNLLRISVGIEDAKTLREDLDQAFQKARK